MTAKKIFTVCSTILACLLAGSLAAKAAGQETLSPVEWARLRIDGCRAEEQRRADDLARLAQSLQSRALSREEQGFPALEAANHAKFVQKEARLRLSELEFLLFRKQKKSVQEMFLEEATSSRTPDRLNRAALEDAIRVLTASATPCTLHALEAALFIAAFGLPLQREWGDPAINGTRILQEVENEYGRRSEVGTPPRQTYLELRENHRERNQDLIKLLLERAIETSPERNRLSADVQGRLLSDVEEFFHLSAEPLRIEMLLDVLVGDFERYLGMRSTEATIDELEHQVQKNLFRDVARMRALETKPPAENLPTLDALLDAWLRRHALPELRKQLYRDPVAAYWFYVQTGMIARRPFVFRGSFLQVPQETPDLARLDRLSFDDAQREILRLKVPWSFVGQYLELEQQLTDLTLSRDEFLQRAQQAGLTARELDTLKKMVSVRGANGSVSTLDFMGVLVRDASRFSGKPNRQALLSGLRILRQAKAQEIKKTIDGLPADAERERLAGFLRIAGEWMLELEERQANERRFQVSNGGGPVGWVLRRTAIGNGLPVEMWAPGGVTGDAFARMVDQVLPANGKSGHNFRAKETPDLRFLESGETYYQALVRVINESQNFLNIQQHDWKLDRGGREIAYRIMAKKLGLSGEDYDALVQQFREGIQLGPTAQEKVLFYDAPINRVKNLLFYKLFASSSRSPVREMRQRIELITGEPLSCPILQSCGDLSRVYEKAGKHYNPRRAEEPGYREAWQLYAELGSLFDGKPREVAQARPRLALADYVRPSSAVRWFVRRHGLTAPGAAQTPFEVNVVTEGKRDTWNLLFKAGRLQSALLEFDVRYLPWKSTIEYPWHLGRIPILGRWALPIVPMFYVPWPWLQSVPGLAWTGLKGSLGFQHLMATDVRNMWGTVTHSKHLSNETTTLESGMGFASKYFNMYPRFRTWHDTGLVARGPITGDANEQYVQWFNRARKNNRGLAELHGVRVPRLQGEAYDYVGAETPGARAWVLTTDPDSRDYNYRGVFMSALAAARENIYIENAFYSDRAISRMLIEKAREFRARVNCSGLSETACAARKRDAVNIYLVLPLATDQLLVDAVGRSDYYEMINEGVKLYLWHPRTGYASQRMLHTKAWLVDYRPGQQGLTYVGSHNADRRSLWSDNEMGLLSASPSFADSVYQDLFLRDMEADSTRVTVAGYEMERRIRPVRTLGRFIRTVVAEIFWAF